MSIIVQDDRFYTDLNRFACTNSLELSFHKIDGSYPELCILCFVGFGGRVIEFTLHHHIPGAGFLHGKMSESPELGDLAGKSFEYIEEPGWLIWYDGEQIFKLPYPEFEYVPAFHAFTVYVMNMFHHVHEHSVLA